MRPGHLRHRVLLQKYEKTRDSYGQQVETWVDVAYVRAGIEPLRGRQIYEDDQQVYETTHRITIYHRDDITDAWRVVHDAVTYDIRSIINPALRDRKIELICRVRT